MVAVARCTAVVSVVLVVTLAVGSVPTSGADGLSTAQSATVDCPSGADGAVFQTDSGLTVTHDGRSVTDNPFVDERTLAFPNLTVSAAGNASVTVAAATDSGRCLRDVEPTAAPIRFEPSSGPVVTVHDPIERLSYADANYSRATTGTDLTYESSATTTVVLDDPALEPGRRLTATDASDGTRLAATRVAADGTATLSLPAGQHDVVLAFAPAETATSTPADGRGPDGPRTTDTATRRVTPSATATTDATPTATPTNTSVPPDPGWQGQLVAYQPSPQTQHVGGLLPLALALWGLALWLLVVRRDRETGLLAATLVAASLRATSDLGQVLLDGLVGVETTLTTANLALEFLTVVLLAAFALQFGGSGRFPRRQATTALGAVGVLGVAAVVTNPLHGLVVTEAAVATGPFSYVTVALGPVGWLLAALTVGLAVLAGVLLIRYVIAGSPRKAWRPVGVIATGLGLAVGVATLDALSLGPVTGYDYSAAGINYFVLASAASLLGHGFQRLTPSGRRSIVADLDDAIVVLDDAWRVVEWNPAAETLFPGLTASRLFDGFLEKAVARPAPDQTVTREFTLAPPSTSDGPDPPEHEDGRLRLQDGDSRAPAEGERDDSRHFIVSTSAVTAEGSVIGYTVRFADVTALKRQVVALERTNERLDRFATALTADLRTPLSNARSETDRLVDSLRATDDPDALDRQAVGTTLASIDRTLERMAALVEDVLGLAREAGLDADEAQVSFDGVAQRAWERIASDGATLTVVEGGTLRADPDHLERLLTVLFRNAVQHGGEGVTVRTRLEDDRFVVADDGPGLPDDLRGDPFEAGVTTSDDASGLGLAVARQRGRAHGWEIEIEDTEIGARVVVTGCDTTPAGGGE